jgi:hypothetical protein
MAFHSPIVPIGPTGPTGYTGFAGSNVTGPTGYTGSIGTNTPNGSVATVLGSVGPTGSHTTVQEWLVVSIGGNTRYIPMF